MPFSKRSIADVYASLSASTVAAISFSSASTSPNFGAKSDQSFAARARCHASKPSVSRRFLRWLCSLVSFVSLS